MDIFQQTVAYWHWIVFGLVLITIELFAPIFVTLWLGVAAIIIGILLTIITIGLGVQLFIWAVLSGIFILSWHRFISPKLRDQTRAGLAKEAIEGQVGIVIAYSPSHNNGQLRFPAPILGNDEWDFIYLDNKDDNSDETAPLAQGDKVTVTDVAGNRLVVKAFS